MIKISLYRNSIRIPLFLGGGVPAGRGGREHKAMYTRWRN